MKFIQNYFLLSLCLVSLDLTAKMTLSEQCLSIGGHLESGLCYCSKANVLGYSKEGTLRYPFLQTCKKRKPFSKGTFNRKKYDLLKKTFANLEIEIQKFSSCETKKNLKVFASHIEQFHSLNVFIEVLKNFSAKDLKKGFRERFVQFLNDFLDIKDEHLKFDNFLASLKGVDFDKFDERREVLVRGILSKEKCSFFFCYLSDIFTWDMTDEKRFVLAIKESQGFYDAQKAFVRMREIYQIENISRYRSKPVSKSEMMRRKRRPSPKSIVDFNLQEEL